MGHGPPVNLFPPGQRPGTRNNNPGVPPLPAGRPPAAPWRRESAFSRAPALFGLGHSLVGSVSQTTVALGSLRPEKKGLRQGLQPHRRMVGWKMYEGVSQLRGNKNRANPGKSAGLFSPTDRLAQGNRGAGSAGGGGRSNSPPAPQRLSLIGIARGFTRPRGNMVILMVTSFLVNAERNWTATP